MSEHEMANIAQALLDAWVSLADEGAMKKLVRDLVKAHQGHTSAPDIALFGRMLAENPRLGLDAACQVAHAISTHRVTMEMDYYTAVDDLKPEDTAGAGMIGFTGFNSSCFYRYARIDWDQLVENLRSDSGLARRTVKAFLRAAVVAVPTGKQKGFAANNPPSLLLAVVRKDGMGWSLVNAFERPVRAHSGSGLVGPSVQALDTYWDRLCQTYGTDTLTCRAALLLDPDLSLQYLAPDQVENMEEWLKKVADALPAGEEAV
jgi:CRISPR system Cascade subunit CasC